MRRPRLLPERRPTVTSRRPLPGTRRLPFPRRSLPTWPGATPAIAQRAARASTRTALTSDVDEPNLPRRAKRVKVEEILWPGPDQRAAARPNELVEAGVVEPYDYRIQLVRFGAHQRAGLDVPPVDP